MMRVLLAPIVYMLAIWVLSSIPGGSLDIKGMDWLTAPTTQNLLHIPLYGGLAYVWVVSLLRLNHTRPLVLAAVLTIAYGIVDEYHQSFVPGRYASVADVALNCVGAGLVLWWGYWRQERWTTLAP